MYNCYCFGVLNIKAITMKMEGIKKTVKFKFFSDFCKTKVLKETVFHYLLHLHIFLSRDF